MKDIYIYIERERDRERERERERERYAVPQMARGVPGRTLEVFLPSRRQGFG